MINYHQTTDYRTNDRKLSMVISDTGNTIYMSGKIHNETNSAIDHLFHCRFNTSTPTLE